MKNIMVSGAVAAGFLASAAHAVEVSGGYIDLGYSTFTDSDDGSKYNLNGSGELAFTRQFSLQLDLGGYSFREIDETGTNVTLHTNFHANDSLSLGAFYGQDSLDMTGLGSLDFDFYGIEAGFDAGPVEIEGYLGRQELSDFSGFDGTIFGVSVARFVTEQWELSANYDYIDNFIGVVDASTLSVGAIYHFNEGAEIYGELGTARLDVSGFSDNETYIGVGVRMNLGNARGTTFGRRGVLDKLPGL